METIIKNSQDNLTLKEKEDELWDIVDAAIHKLTYYDQLTGLPNRLLIENLVSCELKNTKKKEEKIALIYMNLDDFKHVNDTVGYSGGNQLLKIVGDLIKDTMVGLESAARVGENEFVFLLPNIRFVKTIIDFVNKVNQMFSEPLIVRGKEFFVTASMGITLYPEDGNDFESLLKCADIAMYRAKELGKSNYEFFTKELNAEFVEKLELKNSLRHAIKSREFRVFYQPQISLETGEIEGMEALVRWDHSEKGMISPIKFIPLAEETGLIVPLGNIILYEACKQNKLWQEAGYNPLKIAVNFSAKQFEQENLVEIIEGILKESGMEAKWLELEITESTVMKNFDVSIEKLNKLKNKGIRVSLDDFGTGYSSLNYLKRLPIDTLKIDKTFLDNVATDPKDEIIAKAIIELAHKMKLVVVAEGVEYIEQLNFLKKQKCDIVQGFFFSKPVPAEKFEQFLGKNKKFPIDIQYLIGDYVI